MAPHMSGSEREVDTRTLVILALSATAGVTVEFYDFFLYGYAAASAFPSVFFPGLPPTQALVFSFLAFAAGFPARLFGAFVFGHFGDRAGRKAAFIINISLVGLTTCLTGLLPGYATLGIAAPILLVSLRVLQGIGLGGEFGGASALLAEYGSRRKYRAFWMSLANLGIALGGLTASAALLIFSGNFATGGWRIAMLLSAVIVLPALLARFKLADSPLFEDVKRRERVVRMPSVSVLSRYGTRIVLLALIFGFQQMDGVVSGPYIISFMNLSGVPLSTTAALLVIGRVGDALGVIISGPCATLLKRKKVAYLAMGLTTALSAPFVLSILSGRSMRIAVFQFLITFFGVGILHGLAPILTAENFPTRYRYSGSGIAFNLSAIVGGMLAPPLLAGLIGEDVSGRWYYVVMVYVLYCGVGMAALTFIGETRDVDLEELDVDDVSAPADPVRHSVSAAVHSGAPGARVPRAP
jgi:MFS transporter, MHS family, shikimate and dehydroshikimate transport protein